MSIKTMFYNLEADLAARNAAKKLDKEIKEAAKEPKTSAESEYLILEDMPDAFKESYIIAAIAFANADHEINGQELNI